MNDPPPLPAADSVICEACSHGRMDCRGIHVHKLSSHKMRVQGQGTQEFPFMNPQQNASWPQGLSL